MATNIVRKKIPEEKPKEQTDSSYSVDKEETISETTLDPKNNSIDELFDAACQGFEEDIQTILTHFNIINKNEKPPFFKNKKQIAAVFMCIDVIPYTSTKGYQLIGSVSNFLPAIPDDYLAYIVGVEVKTISNMSTEEKKDLIRLLPESTIKSEGYITGIISPGILALSAPSESRPLLGAAVYLARNSGDRCSILHLDTNSEKKIAGTYIPTEYIVMAAEKYNVSDERKIKALKAVGLAKKRYEHKN